MRVLTSYASMCYNVHTNQYVQPDAERLKTLLDINSCIHLIIEFFGDSTPPMDILSNPIIFRRSVICKTRPK